VAAWAPRRAPKQATSPTRRPMHRSTPRVGRSGRRRLSNACEGGQHPRRGT
jgi:hypothetical protein